MKAFYIVIGDKSSRKVVVSSGTTPRVFPKQKKANNFINGRPTLQAKNAIVVTDITGIDSYWKIDI